MATAGWIQIHWVSFRSSTAAGADEIGDAPVPQELLFRDTAIRCAQAIVLATEMDRGRMGLAPNRDTALMLHETSIRLGQVSNRIADWLREHGYAAQAGHLLVGSPSTL